MEDGGDASLLFAPATEKRRGLTLLEISIQISAFRVPIQERKVSFLLPPRVSDRYVQEYGIILASQL